MVQHQIYPRLRAVNSRYRVFILHILPIRFEWVRRALLNFLTNEQLKQEAVFIECLRHLDMTKPLLPGGRLCRVAHLVGSLKPSSKIARPIEPGL